MRHGLECEVVRPESLDEVQRARLTDELFELNQCIFAGVGREQFAHKLFNPSARWTRIQVLRENGTPVGYCAVHLFDMHLHRHHQVVIRAEAGILRQYRGGGTTFAFGFRQAIRYKLLHPRQSVYLFCTLVHPSSFHLLACRFRECYPNHRRATPAAVQTLMYELADAFAEPRLSPDDPAIRQVGWSTRDSAEETAFWLASDTPDVQLFLRLNPGYRQGHGLVILVPLTLGNLLLTLVALPWCRLPHH